MRSIGSSAAQDGAFLQVLMLDLRQMVAENRRTLILWAAVTAFALLAAIVTGGGYYHQLAIGIALSAIVLFVLLSLTEILWRVVGALAG